jgi:hypothetical protein
MKRTILTLAVLAAFMTSCKKEEKLEEKQPTPTADCNCGTVIEKSEMYFLPNIGARVDIRVKNHCSNVNKLFTYAIADGVTYYVTDEYCAGYQW